MIDEHPRVREAVGKGGAHGAVLKRLAPLLDPRDVTLADAACAKVDEVARSWGGNDDAVRVFASVHPPLLALHRDSASAPLAELAYRYAGHAAYPQALDAATAVLAAIRAAPHAPCLQRHSRAALGGEATRAREEVLFVRIRFEALSALARAGEAERDREHLELLARELPAEVPLLQYRGAREDLVAFSLLRAARALRLAALGLPARSYAKPPKQRTPPADAATLRDHARRCLERARPAIALASGELPAEHTWRTWLSFEDALARELDGDVEGARDALRLAREQAQRVSPYAFVPYDDEAARLAI